MRRPSRLVAITALLSAPVLAMAQTSPAQPQPNPVPPATPPASAAAKPAAPPAPDTIIAKVGPDTIHYQDLTDALASLPEQLRALPPSMLYPMLLDQLVDREVIALQARKEGMQNDPAVQRSIQRATELALQNALLTREVKPLLTDEAIQARYEKEYANKPGEEEIRAEHILVPTEEKAKEIIAQLDKGANFADLAKEYSTDPSAKQNNGDLGWFKKEDMLPEFSEAAFALKPGEITKTPVHTRFGWHVIKLEERRVAPPPKLDEVRDEIRQEIIQQAVEKVLAHAKQGVTIEKFNMDGTPMPQSPGPNSASSPTPGTPPASK